MTSAIQRRFDHPRYMIRRKFFRIFGEGFHILDSQGQLAFFANMKGFRLKEDLRVYTGEDRAQEVLALTARGIFDFGATYEVKDTTTGERLGALRRKGLASLLRDEWAILDADDREIGRIQEDSLFFAVLRRVLPFLPQTWIASIRETEVARFHQHLSPWVLKVSVAFSTGTESLLDRRMGIAMAVLLNAVEARQGSR